MLPGALTLPSGTCCDLLIKTSRIYSVCFCSFVLKMQIKVNKGVWSSQHWNKGVWGVEMTTGEGGSSREEFQLSYFHSGEMKTYRWESSRTEDAQLEGAWQRLYDKHPPPVLVGKWGRGLGHFQLSSGLEIDSPPSLQTSAAGVVSSGPGACGHESSSRRGSSNQKQLDLSEIRDGLLKAWGESCHCLWIEEGCEERAEREDGEIGEKGGDEGEARSSGDGGDAPRC